MPALRSSCGSLDGSGSRSKPIRLGPDLAAGERPQAIVPAGAWQSAESLGDWTLVGCTVAPGFRFEGFRAGAARVGAVAGGRAANLTR